MKTKKLFKSVIATTGLCFLLSSCGSTAPAPSYQAVFEAFRPGVTYDPSLPVTNKSSSSNNSQQSSMIANDYNNQGRAYSNQKNYTQAIACYKKALELSPNFYWAYNNIGYDYYLMGEYNAAIPYLQRAIEIEPDNPFAYSNMGGICLALEEYRKAIEYCQRAIDLKDKYNATKRGTYFGYGEPYYYMGLAYAGLNDRGKALTYIKEAARLGNTDAQNLLKEIEKDTKRTTTTTTRTTPQRSNSTSPQRKSSPPQGGGLKKDPNFKIK